MRALPRWVSLSLLGALVFLSSLASLADPSLLFRQTETTLAAPDSSTTVRPPPTAPSPSRRLGLLELTFLPPRLAGVTRDGGMAEYVCMRADACVMCPKSMDPAEVTALMFRGATIFSELGFASPFLSLAELTLSFSLHRLAQQHVRQGWRARCCARRWVSFSLTSLSPLRRSLNSALLPSLPSTAVSASSPATCLAPWDSAPSSSARETNSCAR